MIKTFDSIPSLMMCEHRSALFGAPIPTIMEVNKSSNITACNLSVGCFIDCDQHSVEVNVEPHLLIVQHFEDSLKNAFYRFSTVFVRVRSKAVGAQSSGDSIGQKA